MTTSAYLLLCLGLRLDRPLGPRPRGFRPVVVILASALSLFVPLRWAAAQPFEESAPTESAPTLAELARSDPAVAATLELSRQTPSEIVRAVFILIDLGRPDAAAALIPELTKLEVTPEQRAVLVRDFGSARFLQWIRMAGEPGAPAEFATAKAFAQQALDAASRMNRDPQRLAEWIEQVQGNDAAKRHAARVDLRAAGDPAIAALFAALARATAPAQRGYLLKALLETAPQVEGAVVATLAEGRGTLRRDAAELAGHMRLTSAVPYLALLSVRDDAEPASAAARASLAKLGYSTPSHDEATKLAQRRITAWEQGMPAAHLAPEIDAGATAVGMDPNVATWWQWDVEKEELSWRRATGHDLQVMAAARLAMLLGEEGFAAPVGRQNLLQYGLELASRLDQEPAASVEQALASASTSELSAALGAASKGGQPGAAARIASALGERRDPAALGSVNGLPSALASALDHPDRRVQFAALSAIMQIGPQHSFGGASRVVGALWRFALGAGKGTALVAAPVASRSSDWAGQLRGLGYDARPVFSGREALQAANDPSLHARLALILLDSEISRPTIREVIYQLRNFPPTRGVPIVLFTDEQQTNSMAQLAEAHGKVLSTPRVVDGTGMASAVERALALDAAAKGNFGDATQEERRQQAVEALQWLGQLTRTPNPYDELQRNAHLARQTLPMPELTDATLDLLGGLGTAGSQQALADFASSNQRPITERQRASTAFAASVREFGVLLTRTEALAQYDRYNASEDQDPAVQEVLGALLDALESR